MKKNWQSLLGAILSGAILMASLGACGGTASSSNGGSTIGDSSKVATANGESAEIELFTRFADGPSKQFFEEAATAYMDAHPEVKITVSSADNQTYKQEINVRLASNETPDIYFAWSGVYARNFADGGRALDLTPYIEKDKAWSDNIIQNQFGPFTFGEKIYGIPIIMDGKTFYYNKDIFTELKLEVPENWEEFIVVLDSLKKSEYIPISLGNSEDWATGHYMTTLNQRVVPADVLAKDYSLEGDFTDPTYTKALSYLEQLTPYFTPEFNSVSYDTGISDFTSGKAAIYYEQFNQVQYIEPATFDWGWFDFPAIEGAAGDQNALTGAPQGLMVSADTQYPDESVDFLRFLTSSEMAAKMVKDTMMMSAVDGAINPDTANEKQIEIAKTIKEASSITLWLDNATDSEIVATYLSSVQAMVGGGKTADEVMQDVQKKAEEVKANQ